MWWVSDKSKGNITLQLSGYVVINIVNADLYVRGIKPPTTVIVTNYIFVNLKQRREECLFEFINVVRVGLNCTKITNNP